MATRGGEMDTDLQQLRQLLPGISRNASQLEVMREAARYIDTLQNNVVCRIRTHGYPDNLKTFAGSNSSSSSSSSRSSFQDGDAIRRTVEAYVVSGAPKWGKK